MFGLGVFLTLGARVLALDRVAAEWWAGVGNNIYNMNSGYVGIGTSSPGVKLDIQGNFDGSLDVVKLTNNQWGPGSINETVNIAADLGGEFGPGRAGRLTFGKLDHYSDGASIDAFFAVSVADNNFLKEYLRITNDGNVGIGTTGPSQKLEVNGGVRMNTTTSRPVCGEATRGLMWFVRGEGVGINSSKDSLQVCARDAGGASAWRVVY